MKQQNTKIILLIKLCLAEKFNVHCHTHIQLFTKDTLLNLIFK